jgi:hypothetical protein
MKTISVVKIIKDIFTKMCIYFTILILVLTAAAEYLNLALLPVTYFMFALASLGAGIAAQIFKITKIPAVSRHIAFFILLYLDLLLVIIPLSNYTATNSTTLYLSVIFIVIYAIISGITIGIKSALNTAKNKKSQYDKQFKNIN